MHMRGSDITVVTIGEDDAIDQALRLLKDAGQSLLLVVSPMGITQEQEQEFLSVLSSISKEKKDRAHVVASKNKRVLELAEKAGWQTIDRLSQLKATLPAHPHEQEALRVFSPGFWRSHIRSQLQSLGLLSLPRLRIWILLSVSGFVFLFVFFRLLPSATIHVWPLEETITQTVNVYLVSSGAQVPARVRTLPLYPLTVNIERTMTFNEIGKEFTGKNAEVLMTVVNESDEDYALRAGTRLTNQAGMVFRLAEQVFVEPGAYVNVKAVADPKDLYDEIVGERGNVPAGLKWEFPGLSVEERAKVYGRNDEPAVGGTSSYVNMLREEDLVIAQKKLEKELAITARQQIDEQRELRNSGTNASFVELRYDDLTRISYDNFTLPREFIGTKADSVPITGSIHYTVLLYDEHALFEMLRDELMAIVSDDRVLVPSSIRKEEMVLHVIEAPWDQPIISWVKITVDLSAKQRFSLDPTTPTGLHFAKQVRESVTGKNITEAEKIVKNMPEVSKAEITTWPPWSRWLPSIPSNILLSEEQ